MSIFRGLRSGLARGLLPVFLVLSSGLFLAACAAPAPDDGNPPPVETTAASAPQITESDAVDQTSETTDRNQRRAPPMSQPLPPSKRAAAPGSEPRKITRPGAGSSSGTMVNLQCGNDNDCEIKNVGSCCGERPACVNKNAPVNPTLVAEECKQSGMVSTCGFPAISACQCVKGQCEGSDTGMIQ